MNEIKNEVDTVMISLLKGQGGANDLENNIMKKITIVTMKQKALKTKEKIVIWSYVGLTVISLLAMLILTIEFQVSWPVLKAPSIDAVTIEKYYTLIITCSVLSLISFGTYFLIPKRLSKY